MTTEEFLNKGDRGLVGWWMWVDAGVTTWSFLVVEVENTFEVLAGSPENVSFFTWSHNNVVNRTCLGVFAGLPRECLKRRRRIRSMVRRVSFRRSR